jgi:hypothetical protein
MRTAMQSKTKAPKKDGDLWPLLGWRGMAGLWPVNPHFRRICIRLIEVTAGTLLQWQHDIGATLYRQNRTTNRPVLS